MPNIIEPKKSRIIENIIKNPLIKSIPSDTSLYARSSFVTEFDLHNDYEHNTMGAFIEEGIAMKSENDGKYIKRSISNLNVDSLRKLFNKSVNENKELNYHESIRNVNESSIEEKIELLKFLIGALKDKFKDKEINIHFIDSIEYKIYIDNKDVVFHNGSHIFIQIEIADSNKYFIENIGFNLIYNKLEDAYAKAKVILNSLEKKFMDFPITNPFSSTAMPIILDPLLAGAFIHEIYGHPLEADNASSSSIHKKIKINSNLKINDSPLLSSGIVNYEFDDEGIPALNNTLIEDGKISGLIHDRESSRYTNVNPTGNGRSESYNSDILPRMTNIIIDTDDWELEEAISDMKNGYYAVGFLGGEYHSLYNSFSVSPQLCYKIVNGKIEGVLKNTYITGNIKNTLKNIEAIGNRQETTASMCYKRQQRAYVGIVSPFLKIKKINIL